MSEKKRTMPARPALISLLLMWQLAGCFGTVSPDDPTSISSIASLAFGERARLIEDEFNDSFESATPFRLLKGHFQTIEGELDLASDVDVYDIGPLYAGERLVVDVTANGWLDAAAGVFDGDASLIYLNDDRNYFGELYDPYIDLVMRRDTDRCFVVIASSPHTRSTGTYTVSLSLADGPSVPAARPQRVLLNFDGADAVGFGRRTPVNIPPFEAATVSASLDGRTDELIEVIAAMVREDYEGLDVEFYFDHEQIENGEEFSTIHFGAYDASLLGVAENIDEFNEQGVQEAIVFADTFEIFEALSPTLDEYAQAFANVASHETGHLLGLVHTVDVRGVMDITASLHQLMRNQAFSRSQIEADTFPVGFQDAVLSLVDSVGGDLEMARSLSLGQLAQAKMINAPAEGLARAMLSICLCDRCRAGRHKVGNGSP